MASTQGTKFDTGIDLHQVSTLNEYVSTLACLYCVYVPVTDVDLSTHSGKNVVACTYRLSLVKNLDQLTYIFMRCQVKIKLTFLMHSMRPAIEDQPVN